MLALLLLLPSLLLLGLLWQRFRPHAIHDPSTTAAATSPSSTSPPNGGNSRRNEYKVFLSFRGEDTRNNFVSHLYKELNQKGIHTFKDDPKLERGDSLTSLLDAISSSRVAVVILSEHYASSTWCLKELVKIMECRKTNGQRVVPIFYKVDPSDVRNHKGSFGKDLEEHEKKRKREKDSKAEMEEWRNALTEVAAISGWDSRDRDEAKLIENIVRDVSDKLACVTSSDKCDDLVAIGSQIAEIEKLLEVERKVFMLGISGMGGVGKTTLAKVFYDKMSSQYQDRCFLRNIKDEFKNFGATNLRKKLLSKVLKERDLDIWHLDEDSSMLRERLCCKKVLIVLDDVDDIEQLEVLAKHRSWFDLGSIIIITTRDEHLLDLYQVDVTYKVKCLTDDEALQLFNRHAFKQNQIKKDYGKLAIDFVNYTQRLPLALKVLGCLLYNREIQFWEEELQSLRTTPHPKIFDMLKLSFEDLEENEKEVFLEIACFHNRATKDSITHILSGCCLFPDKAFLILMKRSLISIQDGRVYMHQLLQDMGRKIISYESNNLGERSRLWDSKDIQYVLTKKKGTDRIKGISLKLSEIQGKMILEEDAFMGIDRLRFLEVWGFQYLQDKLQLSHGLQFYSDELVSFRWHGWPHKILPLRFYAQNLVELDMSQSKVETLWEGLQEFVNLKILNLRYSNYLARIPDMSKAQNIVQINLSECESLVEVHSSIQYLGKLEDLWLDGCTNLEILPSRLDSNVLANFSIRGCRKVKKCPEFAPYLGLRTRPSENYCHLPMLDLSKTAFTEFIGFMSGMGTLNLSGCNNLSQLPNWLGNFESVKAIYLVQTSITELPQSIENLKLLESLDVSYCYKLESLPANLHRLSSLLSIGIRGCKRLRSIPKLPPLLSRLGASDCESLENFLDNSKDDIGERKCCWFSFGNCFKLSEKAYNNILSFAESTFQKCKSSQEIQFLLPGREIPSWICEQAVGSSIKVQTPSNFAAVICCLVFNYDGQSLSETVCLEYECQFKGDNGNQDYIEYISKWEPLGCLGGLSSEDEMGVFKLEKPEALDCAVVNELSFKLRVQRVHKWPDDGGRIIEMKVKKWGICFVE